MFDNALYEVIGQEIARAAPQGWREARLEVEAGDGFVDTRFKADVDGAPKSFVLPRDSQTRVEDALMDIRKDLRQSGDAPWTRAELVLTPDGALKFRVKGYSEQAS